MHVNLVSPNVEADAHTDAGLPDVFAESRKV
jgi:hypothetical protein